MIYWLYTKKKRNPFLLSYLFLNLLGEKQISWPCILFTSLERRHSTAENYTFYSMPYGQLRLFYTLLKSKTSEHFETLITVTNSNQNSELVFLSISIQSSPDQISQFSYAFPSFINCRALKTTEFLTAKWLVNLMQESSWNQEMIILPVVTPWTTPSLVLEPKPRKILIWKCIFLSTGKDKIDDKEGLICRQHTVAYNIF